MIPGFLVSGQEARVLVNYLDVDGNGSISEDEFRLFMRAHLSDIFEAHARDVQPIVDVQISRSEEECQQLHRRGYRRILLPVNAPSEAGPTLYMHLLSASDVPLAQRTAALQQAVTSLLVFPKTTHSVLEAAGLRPVPVNLNQGQPGAAPLFLWLGRHPEKCPPFLSLSLTREDEDLPPERGWTRLPDDLMAGAAEQDGRRLLWARRSPSDPDGGEAAPLEERTTVEARVEEVLREPHKVWDEAIANARAELKWTLRRLTRPPRSEERGSSAVLLWRIWCLARVEAVGASDDNTAAPQDEAAADLESQLPSFLVPGGDQSRQEEAARRPEERRPDKGMRPPASMPDPRTESWLQWAQSDDGVGFQAKIRDASGVGSDGKLPWREIERDLFIAGCQALVHPLLKDAVVQHALYDAVDKDKNGSVSVEEMEQFLWLPSPSDVLTTAAATAASVRLDGTHPGTSLARHALQRLVAGVDLGDLWFVPSHGTTATQGSTVADPADASASSSSSWKRRCRGRHGPMDVPEWISRSGIPPFLLVDDWQRCLEAEAWAWSSPEDGRRIHSALPQDHGVVWLQTLVAWLDLAEAEDRSVADAVTALRQCLQQKGRWKQSASASRRDWELVTSRTSGSPKEPSSVRRAARALQQALNDSAAAATHGNDAKASRSEEADSLSAAVVSKQALQCLAESEVNLRRLATMTLSWEALWSRVWGYLAPGPTSTTIPVLSLARWSHPLRGHAEQLLRWVAACQPDVFLAPWDLRDAFLPRKEFTPEVWVERLVQRMDSARMGSGISKRERLLLRIRFEEETATRETTGLAACLRLLLAMSPQQGYPLPSRPWLPRGVSGGEVEKEEEQEEEPTAAPGSGSTRSASSPPSAVLWRVRRSVGSNGAAPHDERDWTPLRQWNRKSQRQTDSDPADLSAGASRLRPCLWLQWVDLSSARASHTAVETEEGTANQSRSGSQGRGERPAAGSPPGPWCKLQVATSQPSSVTSSDESSSDDDEHEESHEEDAGGKKHWVLLGPLAGKARLWGLRGPARSSIGAVVVTSEPAPTTESRVDQDNERGFRPPPQPSPSDEVSTAAPWICAGGWSAGDHNTGLYLWYRRGARVGGFGSWRSETIRAEGSGNNGTTVRRGSREGATEVVDEEEEGIDSGSGSRHDSWPREKRQSSPRVVDGSASSSDDDGEGNGGGRYNARRRRRKPTGTANDANAKARTGASLWISVENGWCLSQPAKDPVRRIALEVTRPKDGGKEPLHSITLRVTPSSSQDNTLCVAEKVAVQCPFPRGGHLVRDGVEIRLGSDRGNKASILSARLGLPNALLRALREQPGSDRKVLLIFRETEGDPNSPVIGKFRLRMRWEPAQVWLKETAAPEDSIANSASVDSVDGGDDHGSMPPDEPAMKHAKWMKSLTRREMPLADCHVPSRSWWRVLRGQRAAASDRRIAHSVPRQLMQAFAGSNAGAQWLMPSTTFARVLRTRLRPLVPPDDDEMESLVAGLQGLTREIAGDGNGGGSDIVDFRVWCELVHAVSVPREEEHMLARGWSSAGAIGRVLFARVISAPGGGWSRLVEAFRVQHTLVQSEPNSPVPLEGPTALDAGKAHLARPWGSEHVSKSGFGCLRGMECLEDAFRWFARVDTLRAVTERLACPMHDRDWDALLRIFSAGSDANETMNVGGYLFQVLSGPLEAVRGMVPRSAAERSLRHKLRVCERVRLGEDIALVGFRTELDPSNDGIVAWDSFIRCAERMNVGVSTTELQSVRARMKPSADGKVPWGRIQAWLELDPQELLRIRGSLRRMVHDQPTSLEDLHAALYERALEQTRAGARRSTIVGSRDFVHCMRDQDAPLDALQVSLLSRHFAAGGHAAREGSGFAVDASLFLTWVDTSIQWNARRHRQHAMEDDRSVGPQQGHSLLQGSVTSWVDVNASLQSLLQRATKEEASAMVAALVGAAASGEQRFAAPSTAPRSIVTTQAQTSGPRIDSTPLEDSGRPAPASPPRVSAAATTQPSPSGPQTPSSATAAARSLPDRLAEALASPTRPPRRREKGGRGEDETRAGTGGGDGIWRDPVFGVDVADDVLRSSRRCRRPERQVGSAEDDERLKMRAVELTEAFRRSGRWTCHVCGWRQSVQFARRCAMCDSANPFLEYDASGVWVVRAPYPGAIGEPTPREEMAHAMHLAAGGAASWRHPPRVEPVDDMQPPQTPRAPGTGAAVSPTSEEVPRSPREVTAEEMPAPPTAVRPTGLPPPPSSSTPRPGTETEEDGRGGTWQTKDAFAEQENSLGTSSLWRRRMGMGKTTSTPQLTRQSTSRQDAPRTADTPSLRETLSSFATQARAAAAGEDTEALQNELRSSLRSSLGGSRHV